MIPKFLKQPVKITTKYPELVPFRANPSDAGADLRSVRDHEIYPGEICMVDTGVAIAIPYGYVGLIYNRSSQGKIRVSLPNSVGVIDSSYRGNLKVLLVNNGEDVYKIKERDTRIAQLVITPIVLADFVVVDSLDETTRGTGGFGSTGV